jgi:Elongation factor Tu C-terminal domain
VQVTVTLGKPVALDVGQTFAIREGGRTVGAAPSPPCSTEPAGAAAGSHQHPGSHLQQPAHSDAHRLFLGLLSAQQVEHDVVNYVVGGGRLDHGPDRPSQGHLANRLIKLHAGPG